jgi:soluble calcium-activated nucleotidase 1
MGCGASTQTPPSAVEKEPVKAAVEPAKPAPPATEAVDTGKPAPPTNGDGEEENGHKPLLKQITSSGLGWKAMNATGTAPAAGMAWPVCLVADQDEASKSDGGWASKLAYGKLIYNGSNGAQSYSLEMKGEADVMTGVGDKSGRGAEYSALEVFAGKLLTFCDRTGACDELVAGEGYQFTVGPAKDKDGNPVILKLGDGSKPKPLKCEWSTQKDGKLWIGSTGKERTDDDGNVVHEGEMWIKIIDPSTLEIENVDWRPVYNGLRDAAICKQGAGYMIHESCRWSDIHQKWFFLPRKASRELYDEIKDASKCVNLMMAAEDGITESDGGKVLMQPYLSKSDLRGCSDFLFVPGTNDTHLFVIRTEESLEGVITTFASVVDLEANVLLEECEIAQDRKFEGAAWVGGFGPFPADGPTETVTFDAPAPVASAEPEAEVVEGGQEEPEPAAEQPAAEEQEEAPAPAGAPEEAAAE